MIHLIDKLFAGWAPHDIMWYSWCILDCLILFAWAVIIGIRRKIGENYQSSYPVHYSRLGSDYDMELFEYDDQR